MTCTIDGCARHDRACPGCGRIDRWGCNPNRPNGPWLRCWACGKLYDGEWHDITEPDFVLAPKQLKP